MRYINRSLLLSTLALLICASPGAAQPTATTNDLGTLGGSSSSEFKVNSNGGVIGFSFTAGDSEDLAFYFDGAVMHSITLGGTSSTASDVNDAGMVVGSSLTAGNLESQAFWWHNGQIRMLSLGGSFGTAVDINEQGMVTGYSTLAGDEVIHAFLYDSVNDSITDIGTLGGTNSFARSINEAGQIIGTSDITNDLASQGFRYSNGQMIGFSLMQDGGSWVNQMNSTGQVTGAAMTAGGEIHAFMYDGVQTFDLGTLGGTVSEGMAINDSGVVGGNSRLSGDVNTSGFTWSGAALQPLSLGGSSSLVVDINNAGDVAGEGYVNNDSFYAAFRFRAGQYETLTLGGSFAFAVGINEHGDLIGAGSLMNSTVALGFRYNDTGLEVVSLGGTASFASSINERGDVTGYSWTSGDSEMHAFLAPGSSDTVAPTTAASTSAAPNGAGWFMSDVTLHLAASDNAGGAGVKEIRYSLDGGATFTTTPGAAASIPFTYHGIHSVHLFSVDNADNQEPVQTFVVQLDKTAPSVSVGTNPAVLTPPNNKMRSVTVSGSITDNLSGIVSASFRVVDEYGLLQPAGSVTVGPSGGYSFVISLRAGRDGKDKDGRFYTVFVRGVDAAGNATESSAQVHVPK
jgi:probable HAF family extracellular repeat protein